MNRWKGSSRSSACSIHRDGPRIGVSVSRKRQAGSCGRGLGEAPQRLIHARQSCGLRSLSQFADEELLVVGDGLLADPELSGDLFVGQPAHEQQLQALQPFQFAAAPPGLDLLPQAVGQHQLFGLAVFAAAGDAAGAAGPVAGGGGFLTIVTDHGDQQRTPTGLPEPVGQLVGTDRKQERLERCRRVVVRQCRQEPDERLLHHIFGQLPVLQPTGRERQQPPLVLVDEPLPRRGFALANAGEEDMIGRGRDKGQRRAYG